MKKINLILTIILVIFISLNFGRVSSAPNYPEMLNDALEKAIMWQDIAISLQKEIEIRDKTIEDLERDIDTLLESINSLKESGQNLIDDAKRLQEEKKSLLNLLGEAEKDIDKLQAQISKLTDRIVFKDEKINELESIIEVQRLTIDKLLKKEKFAWIIAGLTGSVAVVTNINELINLVKK